MRVGVLEFCFASWEGHGLSFALQKPMIELSSQEPPKLAYSKLPDANRSALSIAEPHQLAWFRARGYFSAAGEIFIEHVAKEGFRNLPVTPTPSTFSKVLPYKWEMYCHTDGRRTVVQMGGVLLGFPVFKA